jgi:hypothetical protein
MWRLQMNLYNPLLEEIIYAFQYPKFLSLLSEITGIPQLLPDEYLYAGGISLIGFEGCFLNPHIDNSHDKDRKNYRVLNLLYYVTPDWQEGYGGNLELWDNGLKSPQRTIWSKFNRLVIMKTDKSSYHSVNPVIYDGSRCCVSNYYFSPVSPESEDYFHVTSFRGRPEQKLRDLVLQADIVIRESIRKIFLKELLNLGTPIRNERLCNLRPPLSFNKNDPEIVIQAIKSLFSTPIEINLSVVDNSPYR